MVKVNLLNSILKIKRNVNQRLKKTKDDIKISKKFGKDYFDGERKYGYGGYKYDGRWKPVAKRIVSHFNLKSGSKVLDIGCGKGFLVKDLFEKDFFIITDLNPAKINAFLISFGVHSH